MDNLELFISTAAVGGTGEWLEIPDGKLFWAPDFISSRESQCYFHQLLAELDWRQETIRMFGRDVLQPRLQAWCGEAVYTYSGLTMTPEPWTPTLLAIKSACEQVSKTSFNSVLANLYRDGRDYMGWHQDNEPELGAHPVIASVSLGEERRFVLKHLLRKQKIEFNLKSGSLLIMAGMTQQFWSHSVPKTQRPKQARINLTFRTIL
ncbi:alpha-ketoglutarate-dependent dioxygenase AlkB [Photobacterium sp. SDRW27]|uniref:alpha-ketoglutarate-dependent dioxygenase AlkB family protein n=1 Tax=Photobacterium obscurum TaxID=2829490 RepID=UPI0022444F37|nr:alpha-ketoglutarate-dependent dioxygenase AlkB [Photobacterium obscurum]MCW8331190.1 alpha-ketoglutarate-dependent dioxygenase AlkB [Photobacterium obscurum]